MRMSLMATVKTGFIGHEDGSIDREPVGFLATYNSIWMKKSECNVKSVA